MKQEQTVPFPPAWRRTGSGWLTLQREAAWRAFEQAGWPAKTDEPWRGSDLSRFVAPAVAAPEVHDAGRPVRAARTVSPARPGGVVARRISAASGAVRLPEPFDDTVRIVLRDGVPVPPEHARSDTLPDARPDTMPASLPDVAGVRLAVLAESGDDDVVRAHFGRAVAAAKDAGADAFTLVNTAHFAGGLLVDVQQRATPIAIEILHNTTAPVAFPRVLVHVQAGANATVIERFVGAGATYAVTELAVHDDARLAHAAVCASDAGPDGAAHLHAVFGYQARGSRLHQANVSWGGASVRTNMNLHLAGAGAETEAVGLTLARGTQRVDDWTRIDHAVPDTTSRQDYRCILDGKARTRFAGNVLVRPGAQRTNATQENRNLVLSRGALAESLPQLEIHADDVKCSHGSTVGRLDDDALFFLRTRGIARDDAVTLLTKAFASNVTKTIAHDALRTVLEARLDAWFTEDA
jgi:Fe-S cluster assembly protein SufD